MHRSVSGTPAGRQMISGTVFHFQSIKKSSGCLLVNEIVLITAALFSPAMMQNEIAYGGPV